MRAFSQGAAQSARQAQGHEWGPGTSSCVSGAVDSQQLALGCYDPKPGPFPHPVRCRHLNSESSPLGGAARREALQAREWGGKRGRNMGVQVAPPLQAPRPVTCAFSRATRSHGHLAVSCPCAWPPAPGHKAPGRCWTHPEPGGQSPASPWTPGPPQRPLAPRTGPALGLHSSSQPAWARPGPALSPYEET